MKTELYVVVHTLPTNPNSVASRPMVMDDALRYAATAESIGNLDVSIVSWLA